MPKIYRSIFNKTSNIKVTYKTTNNIMNNLRVRRTTSFEHKTGVYKLICDDCDAFYVGQTGRGFLKRFAEHRPPTHFHSCLLYTSTGRMLIKMETRLDTKDTKAITNCI